MGKERCWCCKKIRSDVELRSTDDRMCQSCFEKNESDLELQRRQTADVGNDKQTPAALGKGRGVKHASTSKEALTVSSRLRDVRTVKNSPSRPTNSPQTQLELQGGNHDDMQSAVKADDCRSGIAEQRQQRSPIAEGTEETASENQTADCVYLQRRVEELTCMVVQQNEVIDGLKKRLDVVLAFLDIPDGCKPSLTLAAELNRIKTCSQPEQPSMQDTAVPVGQSNKAFLAAVHTEMQEVQRRRQNVIVSGLKPVEGLSDIDLFSSLCEKCLPVKPAIDSVHCRRLGKQQPGKVRRFLVALRNEESATELLRCAKMLKQSTEGTGIYINPDLTQAEAQAAFEQRQRRRLRKANKQGFDDGETVLKRAHTTHSLQSTCLMSADAPIFLPNYATNQGIIETCPSELGDEPVAAHRVAYNQSEPAVERDSNFLA